MSVYIDSDVIIAWEKGHFDLPAWVEQRPDETVLFPPTVWQQLVYGVFAWERARAEKRAEYLSRLGFSVSTFSRAHATRAAQIAADLKSEGIGFSDCQIAACALEDEAELLTFNVRHFGRVRGLKLAKP